MKTLDSKQIYKLAEDLLNNPELGYKEYETKKILIEYFKSHDIKVDKQFLQTGFSVSIGSGKPHIGLVAEMDAIPTLNHPYASKLDNAAHACGHYSQCVIMAGVMSLLKQDNFKGKVTLFFTPAEEYTDIKYRESLIKQKKIKYIGGKVNMLQMGIFDDVDLIVHAHAMGDTKYKYSIGSNLGGFVYKKITFNGRAAHAAVTPYLGINALNAYTLFNNAMNMLRETFKDEDMVRIHGMIDEGGQTVNSIPEKVVYECYVRSMNSDALIDVSNRVDMAAKYAAKSIGARASVCTKPGYLPLIPSNKLSNVFNEEMLKLVKKDEIIVNEKSMAAGDIGDLSIFKPTIQFGYAGFKGIPHGSSFVIEDKKFVYIDTTKLVYNGVLKLLNDEKLVNDIKKDFKTRMSKTEYEEYINAK